MIGWTLVVLFYPSLDIQRAPTHVEFHRNLSLETCRQMKRTIGLALETQGLGVRAHCLPDSDVKDRK